MLKFVDNPSVMKTQPIRILAISGSLRAVSSNTALLQAAIALAPENVAITLYRGLSALPHFNPDLEPNEPPAVTDLRSHIKHSDGLLISSPEYAHGVPGVLKNALDWLVSGEEFIGKPVALFNASSRATHAQASLIEIITVMSGRILSETTIDLLGKKLDAAGIVSDAELSSMVRSTIHSFAIAINQVHPARY